MTTVRTTVAHAASIRDAVAHAFVSNLEDSVTIDGVDGRHLARVRRLRTGEIVTLSDGSGAWRAYEIHAIDGETMTCHQIRERCIEPKLVSTLQVAPAIIAKNRFDDMVVALVELGVDAIIPFAARRSVVEWRAEKATTARLRLERLAREAAMQCRRSSLPQICDVANATQLAVHGGDIVVASVDGDAVEHLAPAGSEGWLVVTGPEGGFDPDELAALRVRRPYQSLRLAANVLRAETAPLAAAAVLTTVRR